MGQANTMQYKKNKRITVKFLLELLYRIFSILMICFIDTDTEHKFKFWI